MRLLRNNGLTMFLMILQPPDDHVNEEPVSRCGSTELAVSRCLSYNRRRLNPPHHLCLAFMAVHSFISPTWRFAWVDPPAILFDTIVQVLPLPDADRFELASRPNLQARRRIAGNDGVPVGLIAIDDNTLDRPCPLNALLKKRLAAGRPRCSLEQSSTASMGTVFNLARIGVPAHGMTIFYLAST